jgi:hypothetical protein
MSLDKAIAQHLYKGDVYCNTGSVINKLPKEDKEVLLKALADGVPTHTLVLALRQEGYRTSDNTFATHRAGKCKCPTA